MPGPAARPGASGTGTPGGTHHAPGEAGTAPAGTGQPPAAGPASSPHGTSGTAGPPHGPAGPTTGQAAAGPDAAPGAVPGVPGAAPHAAGAPAPGAARPPWAQQVHDLARHGTPAGDAQPGGGLPAQGLGGPDAVAPWRPPASDPFAQHAQDARPAGLGRRLGARLVDGLFTFGVAAAVAFPLAGRAADHIQGKIDAAEQAGVTRQIWLIDGTTGGYLALVLGAFLLFGLVYEALPTARWGRTLGKRLFGIRVLDVERQDAPRTGAALRRWLTYGVLSLLVLGVVNVVWCLFDRPWRQCWHDKAARTFVAQG
ncbi:RDD family protein [Streptomyces sp. JJ36]|nr:RDD family protein [Streptomyces sp. JJ36]